MNCDNCKKNEATCHYRMNINGRRAEYHLCADCAREMGIESDVFSDFGSMFRDMFGDFFGGGRALSPWEDFGFRMPTMTVPRLEILLDGCPETSREEQKNDEAKGTDPEMSRKRQLNVLRREMKRAAAEENFEKAAEIRDQIRKMESEK